MPAKRKHACEQPGGRKAGGGKRGVVVWDQCEALGPRSLAFLLMFCLQRIVPSGAQGREQESSPCECRHRGAKAIHDGSVQCTLVFVSRGRWRHGDGRGVLVQAASHVARHPERCKLAEDTTKRAVLR